MSTKPSFKDLLSGINHSKKALEPNGGRQTNMRLPTPLRILCFDGGPAAVLDLLVLQKLEESHPGFLEKTSMFCGTSDGALVALSLSFRLQNGDSAKDAIAKTIEFQKRTAHVFAPNLFGWARFLSGLGPIAGNDYAEVLKREFGHQTLKYLRRFPVSLAALNPNQQSIASFMPYGPLALDDFPLWEAGAAVAGLPFFVNIERVGSQKKGEWSDWDRGDWLLDGGLANNDPTMAGISGALLSLAYNDQFRSDYFLTARQYIPYLRVLSFGGIPKKWHVDEWESDSGPRKLGAIGWGWPKLISKVGIPRLIDLVVGGPSIGNGRGLRQIIGVHRYHRFEPELAISKRLFAILLRRGSSRHFWRRDSENSIDSLWREFAREAEKVWQQELCAQESATDPYTKNSLQTWVKSYWTEDWSWAQEGFW